MAAYLDYFGLTVTDYFTDTNGDFFFSLGEAGLSDEEELYLSDRLFGAFALLPEDASVLDVTTTIVASIHAFLPDTYEFRFSTPATHRSLWRDVFDELLETFEHPGHGDHEGVLQQHLADLERQGHNFLRSQEGAAPRNLPREVWSLGPVAKVPIDKERVAKEEEGQREQDACAAARLAAQVAALISWQKAEAQRQVAAREAAHFAALEAEHRQVALEEEHRQEAARLAALEAKHRQVALEEAQRQVAAREATATVMHTASDQGKAKKTSWTWWGWLRRSTTTSPIDTGR